MNIYHAAAGELPEVDFEFDKHVLSMKGEAFPENANTFWDPLLAAVEAYLKATDDVDIEANFRLSYFNSASVKKLYALFSMLNDSACKNNRVMLNWYYEEDDDTMESFGNDLAEDFPVLDCRVIAETA
jgi:hypothetical protein